MAHTIAVLIGLLDWRGFTCGEPAGFGCRFRRQFKSVFSAGGYYILNPCYVGVISMGFGIKSAHGMRRLALATSGYSADVGSLSLHS